MVLRQLLVYDSARRCVEGSERTLCSAVSRSVLCK